MLVVSNPVDVLTYLAADAARTCRQRRCIGLGTQLDTIRFRSLIADAVWRAADAGHGPDPGRTWRQHGADLVERHGGRPAAGEISRLDAAPGRRTVHAHQGLGRRSDQEEGGRRVRRRPGDSGSDRSRSRSTAAASCRCRACRAAATASATWRFRCRPSSARRRRRRAKSSCGPRKSRACARAARCCGNGRYRARHGQ